MGFKGNAGVTVTEYIPAVRPINRKLPLLKTLEEKEPAEVAVTTALVPDGVIEPLIDPLIAVSMVLITGFRL